MDFHIVSLLNHRWHGTRLDTFSQIFSLRLVMIALRIIVVFFATRVKKTIWKRIVLSFIIAAGLSYLVTDIGFKTLLTEEMGARTRPYIAHSTEIFPIGKSYTDASFPSSHMTFSLAMLTVLIIFFPALWPYAIVYALLMARSRMHNGMHYPSDVLAWALIGIWCGWLAIRTSKKIWKIA